MGLGWFQDGIYCGSSGIPRTLQPNSASSNVSVPFALDSFCGTNSIQLTTVWSVAAAYEHFWTPSLRTSIVGAYTHIGYNAAASQMMCGQINGIGPGGGLFGTGTGLTGFSNVPGSNTISGLTNCGDGSFDWSYWSVSSRTQWNITKDFYVGLEGYYGHLNTMSKGQTAVYFSGTGTGQPSGLRTLDDQNLFVYRMRVHRDLVP